MRCDQCGNEIRSGEDSLLTTVEVVDPTALRAVVMGPKTRSVPLALCERCAARRKTTLRWFLWALVLLICGMLVLSVVFWLTDLFTANQ